MAFGDNLLTGCFILARSNSEKSGGPGGENPPKKDSGPEGNGNGKDADTKEAESFIKRHRTLLERLFDR